MADEGLFVKFSVEARLDPHATAEQGKNVWTNREYVTIHVPGDKTNIPHRPVTGKDRRRFSSPYEAWKRGLQNAPEGQPLREWAAILPAEVQMLAQAHVYTVEQLAAVSDANAQAIGPILALRDKARRHVEQASQSAPVEALQAKLEEQARELAELKEALQERRRRKPRAEREAQPEEQAAPEEQPEPPEEA